MGSNSEDDERRKIINDTFNNFDIIFKDFDKGFQKPKSKTDSIKSFEDISSSKKTIENTNSSEPSVNKFKGDFDDIFGNSEANDREPRSFKDIFGNNETIKKDNNKTSSGKGDFDDIFGDPPSNNMHKNNSETKQERFTSESEESSNIFDFGESELVNAYKNSALPQQDKKGTDNVYSEKISKSSRKTEIIGVVKKCPSCSSLVESFQTRC